MVAAGVQVHVGALAQGLEVAPQGERDLEVAGDFVAQLQALGDEVVGLGLLGVPRLGQQGQAGEFFGGQQAAFDADGAVGKLVERAGHGRGVSGRAAGCGRWCSSAAPRA